ncbi:MAG TPA: hypothetical protein V6C85_21440 [Allocoleopsis sp.]
MRTKVYFIPLLASFLVGGYPAATQLVRAEPAAQAAQSQWEKFSSPEGKFSILMPVKPTQEKQTTGSSSLSLETNLFKASSNNNQATYSVSYTDFPPELAQLPASFLFDSLSSRFTSDRKLKLLKQQDIKLNEYPGKEFQFEASGRTLITYRAYLVEKRLYQVISETPKSTGNAPSSDSEKFLNSFQLLK